MMKKMWKKNTKAVSPVIATILMVAITVVLAAVLYVMVMGFGGSETAQAPAVTLSKTTMGGKTAIVISIDRQVDLKNIGIAIDGTYNGTLESTGKLVQDNHYFNYTFTPLNDGKLSTGDRIVVDDVTAGTTFQLVWMPSGPDGGDKQLVGTVLTF
jgi:flagellin-like protein